MEKEILYTGQNQSTQGSIKQDRLRQVTNNFKIETQKLLQIINITVGTGSSAKMSYEPMTDVAVQNFR